MKPSINLILLLSDSLYHMSKFNQSISAILQKQGFLQIDGALATELERRGADLRHPLWSAKILTDRPEWIREVHLDYFRSGADLAISASYQASIAGFKKNGLSEATGKAAIRRSVVLAQEARALFWQEVKKENRVFPLIAASIGPYGAYLADGSEYRGNYGLSVNELMDFHRSRLEVLLEAQPDLLAFETIPSLKEAEALLKLLEDYPGVNAWLSFSCRDGLHICGGDLFSEAVKLAAHHPKISAVGVNCTPPQFVKNLLRVAKKHTFKPLLAYPNSGEGWDAARRCWTPANTAESLDKLALEWHAVGARLIGGCCRTGPEDIRRIRAGLWKRLAS